MTISRPRTRRRRIGIGEESFDSGWEGDSVSQTQSNLDVDSVGITVTYLLHFHRARQLILLLFQFFVNIIVSFRLSSFAAVVVTRVCSSYHFRRTDRSE